MGRGDRYFSIPLSAKKSYKVANDTSHDKAFTIQAFTYESDSGQSLYQGALPSLIQQAMANSDIEISSSTGRVYVNISVKEEAEKPVVGLLGKLPFSGPFQLIAGGLKMLHGLSEVAKPKEVHFSITAMETPATVYRFKGAATLNAINIALWRKKAFAIADTTTAGTVEAVVGALAEGVGGLDGLAGEIGGLAGNLLELKDRALG
jgi:hypothetical protein